MNSIRCNVFNIIIVLGLILYFKVEIDISIHEVVLIFSKRRRKYL